MEVGPWDFMVRKGIATLVAVGAEIYRSMVQVDCDGWIELFQEHQIGSHKGDAYCTL